MGAALARLKDMLFSKQLEVVLVGLENSGKSTFCSCLELGRATEQPPTVGLSVKFLKKRNVSFKVWDIGGQAQYRSEWGRYARGVDVIAFVVDTQAPDQVAVARHELSRLLEDRELARLPLLVLANKVDLGPKVSEADLIKGLNLDYITQSPWLVIPISAKEGTNVDRAVSFLTKYAR